jgi:AraC-like DNA-binding protein
MAAAFGVSAHDLSNEIRLGTGNNLGQYITNRRMARARMLLEAGNLPLKQVAFEVGYSHASNFCTAFKRHFGKPPKSLLRHCH